MDLFQPSDSFIIQEIKPEWKKPCNAEVMKMIEIKMWTDARNGSGILVNPEKSYFLKLFADFVRDVSQRREKDGFC